MFSTNNNAAESNSTSTKAIMAQIAQQANSVREAFEDVPRQNVVSKETAAAAALMASMNKKRSAKPEQASLSSTRHFHSSIAHITSSRSPNTNSHKAPPATQGAAAKVSPVQSQALANVLLQLNKNDVVVSGNEFARDLVGNRRFRVWIDLHYESFSRASDADERFKIARSIVDTIHSSIPTGRFLAMSLSGALCDVGYERAIGVTLSILQLQIKNLPKTPQVKPVSPPTTCERKTYNSSAA